jgi:transcriptional regulator with XRE-family HTH domain
VPFKIALDMRKGTRVPKETLGQRLRTLRQARGLTQVQLAKASNITQRAISYYETDTGLPPAPAAAALARALNVSTDELLGLKVPKVDHLDDDAETRRLWKRFRKVASLPERDQRAVIRLINSLASSGGRAEAR